MFATLVRAAYSPNIRERRDCSVGVFDAAGNLVALSAIGPIHLSSLMGLVARITDEFPAATLASGDCFMTNDPYVGGGSHLPDITLVSPVFHHNELVAFVANIAHHSDIGGRVPGSESADCTSIFQEGLRIPIVRLARGDAIVRDVFAFLTLNSRTPDEREGDVRAQLAANRTGVERVSAVFETFGVDTVRAAVDALLDHAERRVRTAITALPDGTWSHEEWLDNDGLEASLTPMRVAVTINGSRIHFDFAGTGAQVAGARNMTLLATLAGVYYAVKALLDPDLPVNSGYYRAIEVTAPRGCLLNATAPAAVGDRAATGNILGDLIFGAFAQVTPERVCAACGPYAGVVTAGPDPRSGGYFVDYETFAGASGALVDADGRDAVRVHVSGSANLPVEALEQEYPLVVVRYELLADSGGAGMMRGGLGTRRDVMVVADGCRISGRGLRHRDGARGMAGGHPGRAGRFVLHPDRPEARVLGAAFSDVTMDDGDVVCIETPGGGGSGAPALRDPASVLADVRDGRVSIEEARTVYRVEFDENGVDDRATAALRDSGHP
jgi:N-methylhydantoinase B